MFNSRFLVMAEKLPQMHSTTFPKDGVDSLDIVIEWPKGSVRTGTDDHGKHWKRDMKADYGYIKGVNGHDGEPQDVYVGEDTDSDTVYAIQQLKEDGETLDEVKLVLGMGDLLSARDLYLAHFPSEWEDTRLGEIAEISFEELLDMVDAKLDPDESKSAALTDPDGNVTGLRRQPDYMAEDSYCKKMNDANEKTAADITQTPGFKAWFGNSKVVDAQGNPVRVYHGTKTAGFDEFDFTDVSPTGRMYFTESPEYASEYASEAFHPARESTGHAVYPVYLSIQNPVDINKLLSYDPNSPDPTYDDIGYSAKSWAEHGFDGAVGMEHDLKIWIAFRPNQIKSATGNNGSFDVNNPSITASTRVAAKISMPTVDFDELWHVGEMDISKKNPGSYEGSGLSVSVNPEAWEEISPNTAGAYWLLTKPGNRFLDFYGVWENTQLRQSVIQWGIQQGYVESKMLYRVGWYDDELEDTVYMEFNTREEAEREAPGLEDGDQTIEEVPEGITPTAKLGQYVGETVSLANTPDMLCSAYAEQVMHLDGVWWDEILSPEILSAPRGVIFNSKLPSWTKKQVKSASTKMCTCGHAMDIHVHPPDFGCPHESEGCGCVGATEVREKTASSGYPSSLNGLVAEAKKCATFAEFKNDFGDEIKHGRYYHVTSDPDFTINPAKGPRDMSSLAGGQMSEGKLMITSHLENWTDYYNYDENEKKKATRPYVALIDMSQVPRKAYWQSNRGFGNEFWVEDPSKAKVIAVVPVQNALAQSKRYAALLAKFFNSNEDLEKFYNAVTGNSSKTPSDLADNAGEDCTGRKKITLAATRRKQDVTDDDKIPGEYGMYDNVTRPPQGRTFIWTYNNTYGPRLRQGGYADHYLMFSANPKNGEQSQKLYDQSNRGYAIVDDKNQTITLKISQNVVDFLGFIPGKVIKMFEETFPAYDIVAGDTHYASKAKKEAAQRKNSGWGTYTSALASVIQTNDTEFFRRALRQLHPNQQYGGLTKEQQSQVLQLAQKFKEDTYKPK